MEWNRPRAQEGIRGIILECLKDEGSIGLL